MAQDLNTSLISLKESLNRSISALNRSEVSKKYAQMFELDILNKTMFHSSTHMTINSSVDSRIIEEFNALMKELERIKNISNEISRNQAYLEYKKVEERLEKVLFDRREFDNLREQDFELYSSVILILSRTYLLDEMLEWLDKAEERMQGLIPNEKNYHHFIRLYDTKSDMLRQKGSDEDYELSQIYLEKAQDILSEYSKWNLALDVNIHKGEFCYRTGLFEEAKEAFEESLTRHLGEAEKKITLPSSLQSSEMLNAIVKRNERMVAFCYMQLTQLYIAWSERSEKKLEQAEECLKLCLKQAEKLKKLRDKDNYKFFKGRSLYHDGLISKNEKKLEQGRELLREVLPDGHYLDSMYQSQFEKIMRRKDYLSTSLWSEGFTEASSP